MTMLVADPRARPFDFRRRRLSRSRRDGRSSPEIGDSLHSEGDERRERDESEDGDVDRLDVYEEDGEEDE